MQGLALYRLYKKEANAQARELFEKAISLDSEFARAYAMLAATHRQDGNMGWTQDRDISETLADHLAHKAVEVARRELPPQPSLPYALEQLGWVLLYQHKNHEETIARVKEAIQLNPNFAAGYALWAHALTYLGEPEESLRKTDEAMSLDPKESRQRDYHRGHAYYVWGLLTSETDVSASTQHYRDAEKHLRAALSKNDNFRPARGFLVAVLWELGRREEAQTEMRRLLEVRSSMVSQHLERFQAFIERSLPYNPVASLRDAGRPQILEHLSKTWQDAEKYTSP